MFPRKPTWNTSEVVTCGSRNANNIVEAATEDFIRRAAVVPEEFLLRLRNLRGSQREIARTRPKQNIYVVLLKQPKHILASAGASAFIVVPDQANGPCDASNGNAFNHQHRILRLCWHSGPAARTC
jgi:hypothetical protein